MIQSSEEETEKHRQELKKHYISPSSPLPSHQTSANKYFNRVRNTDRYSLEADFPTPPFIKPVDRAPYRASPHTQEVIDKCVDQMAKTGKVDQQPSPWGSTVMLKLTEGPDPG